MGFDHKTTSINVRQPKQETQDGNELQGQTRTRRRRRTTTTTTSKINEINPVQNKERVTFNKLRDQENLSFFKKDIPKKFDNFLTQILTLELSGRKYTTLGEISFRMCIIPVPWMAVMDTIPLEFGLEEIPLFSLVIWHPVLSPRSRSNLVHFGDIPLTHMMSQTQIANTNTCLNAYISSDESYCLTANLHCMIGVVCSLIVFSNLIWLGLVGRRPWCHRNQSDFCKGENSREWYSISAWNVRLQELSHIKALHVTLVALSSKETKFIKITTIEIQKGNFGTKRKNLKLCLRYEILYNVL